MRVPYIFSVSGLHVGFLLLFWLLSLNQFPTHKRLSP
jgi:hypothetical protein